MAIVASNRIQTSRSHEVVVNKHDQGCPQTVTVTVYLGGASFTLHLSEADTFALAKALENTANGIDEADIVPEETARDRFIENVVR